MFSWWQLKYLVVNTVEEVRKYYNKCNLCSAKSCLILRDAANNKLLLMRLGFNYSK